MACSIGSGGTAVCLATLSEFEGLTTEGALVDFALLCSGEGDTEMLKLKGMVLERTLRDLP